MGRLMPGLGNHGLRFYCFLVFAVMAVVLRKNRFDTCLISGCGGNYVCIQRRLWRNRIKTSTVDFIPFGHLPLAAV